MTEDRIEYRCEYVFTPPALDHPVHCTEAKGHDGECRSSPIGERSWGFGGVRVAMVELTGVGWIDVNHTAVNPAV